MTPERWEQIEALVDAALDVPAADRDAWLRAACAGDAGLHGEVARLLAAVDDESPVLDAGARSFAGLVAALEEPEAPPAPDAPPPRVGAWRVVAPAGEGGMGTVYVVERDDGQYRMRAALKVVRRGLHLDATFLRRFRDERQILARLDHPNIARLLDGGVTDDGRPYYVMEYVAGTPIDRWCDASRLAVDDRLALFAKVCDAVAAAHRRDIVHRDLKPSNVLVTADGDPKLLDFGIAKTLAPLVHTTEWAAVPDGSTSPTSLTRTGERLLTPEYASPEQIRGEAVTAATDVYALGVLLYELLTGQRPYHGRDRSRHEIERAILEEAPTRPSAVAARSAALGLAPDDLPRRLRGDLDTIVLTALRKEPERRYATAAELGADVRRHLAGEPVAARGDSIAYRSRVWVSRHRRTAVAAAAGTVVGGVLLGAMVQRRATTAAATLGAASGLAYEVTTRSTLARRYFVDGLRAHGRGTWNAATRLFVAALGEDSTFALAAMYGSDAASRDEDYTTSRTLLDQSVRHARRASPRERFIVHAYAAMRFRSPDLGPYADSLERRFGDSPDAAYWRGRVDELAGDWSAAIASFRRAIARDSANRTRGLVPCVACEARMELVQTYVEADSLREATREAREVIAEQPNGASAWQTLAFIQMIQGGTDEEAFRRWVELDPNDADYAVEWVANRRLRAADFRAADELLRGRMETAPPGRKERSTGWLVTSYRMQERWAEAYALARQFRALAPETRPESVHPAAFLEAQLLFESGRWRESAALYDSISRWPFGAAVGYRAWYLTHVATALHAGGDTATLGALIDTIQTTGQRSGFGRDAKLHHHVRGLLLASRGRDEEAIAEFRRGIFSWNLGFTRTNLELARALMRLGRAAEAVAALQPALRGSLEVSNSYVTHTELHRELARAWRMAGNADSAQAHAHWVRKATGR